MESVYTLAGRELAERRAENTRLLDQRIQSVKSSAPEEYTRIEDGLRQGGTALLRCILEGGSYAEAESTIRQLQKDRETLLKRLGYPADYLNEIYTCKLCRDTGYDEKGNRCNCFRQLVAKHSGDFANLTEHMKEQTFDRVDYRLFANQPQDNGRHPLAYMKAVYEKGLRFAETFDETHANLLLMGNAGTGKTYLSSCIANFVIGRGKSVCYQSAFQLFDLLEKLKFGRLSEEEAERVSRLSRQIYQTDLLIIDDLGTEFVTSYTAAVAFDIINSRQMQGKSTILSTNLNSEALEQIYSKRFTSRVWGNFEIIPFIGQDLRMQKHIRQDS